MRFRLQQVILPDLAAEGLEGAHPARVKGAVAVCFRALTPVAPLYSLPVPIRVATTEPVLWVAALSPTTCQL